MGERRLPEKKERLINVDDYAQVRNSAMAMGVSQDELKAAVEKVGNAYWTVYNHLSKPAGPKYYHNSRSI